MNVAFQKYVETLEPKFQKLVLMEPVHSSTSRALPSKPGVYVFSEGDDHLYVGRTKNIKKRYSQHCRPKASQNGAPFAFKLARIATGNTVAKYAKGAGNRSQLILEPNFFSAFQSALNRISLMDFRYVEEDEPTAQYLLEVYCSVAFGAAHNDFKTT